jgi:hypothetical protein
MYYGMFSKTSRTSELFDQDHISIAFIRHFLKFEVELRSSYLWLVKMNLKSILKCIRKELDSDNMMLLC